MHRVTRPPLVVALTLALVLLVARVPRTTLAATCWSLDSREPQVAQAGSWLDAYSASVSSGGHLFVSNTGAVMHTNGAAFFDGLGRPGTIEVAASTFADVAPALVPDLLGPGGTVPSKVPFYGGTKVSDVRIGADGIAATIPGPGLFPDIEATGTLTVQDGKIISSATAGGEDASSHLQSSIQRMKAAFDRGNLRAVSVSRRTA